MRKLLRLLAAAVIAFALAGLSVGVAAGPAHAAPIINPNQTGSLTIHKYLGAANANLPNDGRELTQAQLDQLPAGTAPLSGIMFDAYRVGGVDLTTNEGWVAAAALKKHTITQAEITAGQIVIGGTTYPLTKQAAAPVTNAQGVTTYGNLPVGLYLVNENLADSTHPDKAQITPSAPFLVTVPISYNDPADATKDTWIYNIHVYPKNTQDSIKKQVLDGNVGTPGQDAPQVGTDLTYRLDSTISAISDVNGDGVVNGADLGMYVVGDGLSAFVTYKSATLTIKNATAGGADQALTPVTDYTVASGAAGQPVVFTFTAEGRNKLVAAKIANPAAVVQTDIVATITSLPASGLVPNEAYFIPNQGWFNQNPGKPGIPSNEVVSKYGDILIKKTDDTGTTLLAGAVFEVYRAPAWNSCDNLVLGAPLKTSAATNAQGLTEFSGLQLSNWYNDGETSGAITDQTQFHNYCLVEVKAPEGYQLLAKPVLFSLTKEGVTTALDGQQVEIKNLPDNLNNNLPLTGGEGIAAISVIGLLLIGGGFAYQAVNRRKEKRA